MRGGGAVSDAGRRSVAASAAAAAADDESIPFPLLRASTAASSAISSQHLLVLLLSLLHRCKREHEIQGQSPLSRADSLQKKAKEKSEEALIFFALFPSFTAVVSRFTDSALFSRFLALFTTYFPSLFHV